MIIIIKIIIIILMSSVVGHKFTAGDSFSLAFFFYKLREHLLAFLRILNVLDHETAHGFVRAVNLDGPQTEYSLEK